MYYTCIACITVDSVIRMNKENKKIQMPRFINVELETDSESDLETNSEPDTITED